MMTTTPILASKKQVSELPDGHLVISTPDCLWPSRYAGMVWRKDGSILSGLEKDVLTGKHSAAALFAFADPLPVTALDPESEEGQRVLATLRPLEVGDEVMPLDFHEYERGLLARGYLLTVTRVFKNGSVQAEGSPGEPAKLRSHAVRSQARDAGPRSRSRGPAQLFYRPAVGLSPRQKYLSECTDAEVERILTARGGR